MSSAEVKWKNRKSVDQTKSPSLTGAHDFDKNGKKSQTEEFKSALSGKGKRTTTLNNTPIERCLEGTQPLQP